MKSSPFFALPRLCWVSNITRTRRRKKGKVNRRGNGDERFGARNRNEEEARRGNNEKWKRGK